MNEETANPATLKLNINDNSVISNVDAKLDPVSEVTVNINGQDITTPVNVSKLEFIADASNISLDSLLLHLKKDSSDELVSYSEALNDLIDSFIEDSEVKNMTELHDLFNLLLVPKPSFIKLVNKWKNELKDINDKLDELKDKVIKYPKLKVHKGMIIFSSTDDLEAKVIDHYGGIRWKRIMHFIRGGVNDDEMGKRGGSEYVSLTRDNLSSHFHSLKLSKVPDYKWMTDRSKTNSVNVPISKWAANSNGVDFPTNNGNLKMNAMISGLDYNSETEDANKDANKDAEEDQTKSLHIPHLNLPTYVNCYIWECIQAEPTDTGLQDNTWELSLWERKQRQAQEKKFKELNQLRDVISEIEYTLKTNNLDWLNTKESTVLTQTEDEVENKIVKFQTKFDHISDDDLKNYYLLLSEKINNDMEFRFESKLLPLSELAELTRDRIFEEILRLDFLTRIEYQANIQDIYSMIYDILLKMNDIESFADKLNGKFTAQPGQYVFIYDDNGDVDINDLFILPDNYMFVKQQSCFFRGVGELDYNLSLGKNIVEITNDNLPPHRHFQSKIALNDGSAWWAKTNKNYNQKLKKGAQLTKGNEIFDKEGNLKIGYNNNNIFDGKGDFEFDVNPSGVNESFKHNNIPPFIVLTCYKVVSKFS